MDLSKIFLKDACPTSIGGQAVMGGVMMRGTDRMAIAMRVPDGRIHIKTQPIKAVGRWAKIPILRGVVSFFSSINTPPFFIPLTVSRAHGLCASTPAANAA